MDATRDLLGVLFDWDGTVADTREAMFRSYRYAFHTHLGIEFPKTDVEFRNIVKMRTAEMADIYGGSAAAGVAEAYNHYYNSEAYAGVRAFPGMVSTLRELKARGYRLGMATNKGLERVLTDLNHLDLHSLFETVVTSEDTAERKPHPAPLLKAAERLGIDPARCAYAGDYPGDVMAAKAAGMTSIGVLWGRIFPEEELRTQRPDYLLQSPEQLLQVFTGR